MKTITDIHRENLRHLVAEFGGPTAVADKIGCTPSQFSQWLNGSKNSGTGKPRGISTATARRIERACGKPPAWMDYEHSITQTVTVNPTSELDEMYELIEMYRKLDPRGRAVILDVAREQTRRLAPSDQRKLLPP